MNLQDLTSAIIGVPVMVITFIILLSLSRQPRAEKIQKTTNTE